jgi:ubiquinone/menaquinone biosynthesis C-methylase UbiE
MSDERIPLEARRILNLGSGRKYDPNAVNLDVTPDTDPDVVHDLNQLPWPFPDNRFDRIEMLDVLEHLGDTVRVMEEIHRVCRPEAIVHIVVPHFSSDGAYADPTHKRVFAAGTFGYFTKDHPNNFYTKVRFAIERCQIVFRPTLGNKIVWRLANRFIVAYERAWAWIFPAWFLSVVLRVEK